MTILSPCGPLPKPWWQVVLTMYREMSSFRFYPVTSWATLKPWWQVLITIFQFYPVTLWAPPNPGGRCCLHYSAVLGQISM